MEAVNESNENRPKRCCSSTQWLLTILLLCVSGSSFSYIWIYYIGDTSSRRRYVSGQIAKHAEHFRQNPNERHSFDTLVDYARSDYSFGRSQALAALGNLGPLASPAVPILIKNLRSEDGYARREAARAIGKVGPAASSAAPDLASVVKQWEGTDASWFAAESLGKIGPLDDAAVRTLKEATRSDDLMLRETATNALEEAEIPWE